MAKWLVPLLIACLFAGCMGDTNAVTASYQGSGAGAQTKSLQCDGDGQIALGIQGTGTVSVTVTDGSGKTIFTENWSGQGQSGETQPLSGAEGEWTLNINRGATFNGQYGITMSC